MCVNLMDLMDRMALSASPRRLSPLAADRVLSGWRSNE